MSTHAYTEDQLVEQPAIRLLAELGWSTMSALEETFGVAGTLSRETKGNVVLVSRLRAALERLNPALPPGARPGILFEWLTANLCKYRMVSKFLFELKTAR